MNERNFLTSSGYLNLEKTHKKKQFRIIKEKIMKKEKNPYYVRLIIERKQQRLKILKKL